jgi:hypothetical protein
LETHAHCRCSRHTQGEEAEEGTEAAEAPAGCATPPREPELQYALTRALLNMSYHRGNAALMLTAGVLPPLWRGENHLSLSLALPCRTTGATPR